MSVQRAGDHSIMSFHAASPGALQAANIIISKLFESLSFTGLSSVFTSPILCQDL